MSGSIVILTGAGISVPSGLRPYRGEGGAWDEDPDAAALSNATALDEHLPRLWTYWATARAQTLAAEPNAAHVAIAELQRRRADVTLVTMNVDGLHQLAGSTGVLEVHGNIHHSPCIAQCGQPAWPDIDVSGDVPTCPSCGGPARPTVVLFGEAPVVEPMWLAKRAVRDVATFIAIGTSDSVTTGSKLTYNARFAGAHTIHVNTEPPLEPADWSEVVIGSATDVLPALLAGA